MLWWGVELGGWVAGRDRVVSVVREKFSNLGKKKQKWEHDHTHKNQKMRNKKT